MTNSTHAPLPLGFYDPHTRRSVVGYQPDGSPIWVTWRAASAVTLAGSPGTGKTHLLHALVQGMSDHVSVSVIDGKAGFEWADLADTFAAFDASGDVERAASVVRDVVYAFSAEPPARPRLIIVDEASAFTHPAAEDFWQLVRNAALRGRQHHTTVLIASQKVSALPGWYRGIATETLALRALTEQDVDALPSDMRDAVLAVRNLPRDAYPLVRGDDGAGIKQGSTRVPEPHSPACDCVQRATALLSEHAAHVA